MLKNLFDDCIIPILGALFIVILVYLGIKYNEIKTIEKYNNIELNGENLQLNDENNVYMNVLRKIPKIM
jgi:hypothetical protein